MPLMTITVIIGIFATIIAMRLLGIFESSLADHGGRSSKFLGVIGGVILAAILLPVTWLASRKVLISPATPDDLQKYAGR